MRPPSLAVVGSGPAAFYTLLQLQKRIPAVCVDMFEKHAVPYGLTRFGVAPDHPEVKNCQERFEEVAAASRDFRFWGNCEVGRDVRLATLLRAYDAVLLAYGAASERQLGIPGEHTTHGVLSARQFVGWYNGEPEYQGLDVADLLADAETATIIGNGNVAFDVARMLLRKPEYLRTTDITEQALATLSRSRVRHVQVVGRRGLLHSAFTNKELRELQQEPGCTMRPVVPEAERSAVGKTRQDKRKVDLLNKAASETAAGAGDERTWQLEFLRSPRRFLSDANNRLTGIEWTVNEHDPDAPGRVRPTQATQATATGMAFKSIGYRSVPLPGMAEAGIPFDDHAGVVRNRVGRVDSCPSVFAAGWVKTGPVGVIASTMMDSFAVGEEIAQYLQQLSGQRPGRDALELEPGHGRVVSWQDWQRVDEEEVLRGRAEGRPRAKFTSTREILQFLDR